MTFINNYHSITKITILTAICFFLALTGASNKVQAQNSLQDTTLSLDEIIVSANKMEQPVSKTGRSVSVITRREIEQSTYVNVGQILAQQKGHPHGGQRTDSGRLAICFPAQRR